MAEAERADPKAPTLCVPAWERGEFTAEELATEVAPSGKHQGAAFAAILEDAAFCKWVCKEPRERGWMSALKLYIEAERPDFAPELTEAAIVPVTAEEEAAAAAEEEAAAAMAAARAKLLAKGA